MTRQQIHELLPAGGTRRRSIVVAAAGNLDHAERGAAGPAGVRPGRPVDARRRRRAPRRRGRAGAAREPAVTGARQGHRAGAPGARLRPASPGTDERRFALGVLNNVLGGGMSSRLFQEIREKRGLAYSVYSYTSQYADAGVFGVYAGCAPGKVDEVLELTRDELARVAADGHHRRRSCARGKGMFKGSLVLGLEDTGSRMSRLGKGELLYDELLTRGRAAGPGRRGDPGRRERRSPPSCSAGRCPSRWSARSPSTTSPPARSSRRSPTSRLRRPQRPAAPVASLAAVAAPSEPLARRVGRADGARSRRRTRWAVDA